MVGRGCCYWGDGVIKPGDTFTIAHVYKTISRKWWQVWKPRRVSTGELQTFTVAERLSAETIAKNWWESMTEAEQRACWRRTLEWFEHSQDSDK